MDRFANLFWQALEACGTSFEGRPDSPFAHGPKEVYIRATNIRDASRLLNSSSGKPDDWKIECVSADEFNKVCSSLSLPSFDVTC